MAKEQKKPEQQPDQKEIKGVAKLDFGVEVESLSDDKYHSDGERFTMGKAQAEKAEAQGRVKIIGPAKALLILIMAFATLSFSSQAQVSVDRSLTSVYSLASDTVTNTGTVYLTSPRVAGQGVVTVQVNVTKISGTVGGTISLLGSLDGTNFKALNTRETQTALATISATDASNVYHWRLQDSPFLYYRVSWTGTGTMAASFTARIMKH